jgi:thiosulfate/3-mercaptopyruvate sulfurtransferase
MSSTLLITAAQLNDLIRSGNCTVVDCRFDLASAGRGRQQWLAGHVPGAAYAHLDNDLSSPITPDSGRHPLPDPGKFARYLASTGWCSDRLLVAYDEQSNAIAARLWWLMRYFGKTSALLDGGLKAWTDAGLPLESGTHDIQARPVAELRPDDAMVAGAGHIQAGLDSGELTVLDARASDRFRGENETLDSRAGHIPGSLNRPFATNLDMRGRFRPASELRDEFQSILRGAGGKDVVHSCGSGVTACHNQFAMEVAGLGGTRLYPGSWSEWIRDPARPIETGASSA